MANADLTKSEAIEQRDRARSAIRRIREQSQQVTNRGLRIMGAGAGGALSGVLQVKMPFFPGTRVDSGQILSALVSAAAVFNLVGDEKTNEFLVGVAGGLVAAEAKDLAVAAMLAPRVQPQ